MSSPATYKTELEGMQSLLRAQSTFLNQTAFDELMSLQCKSFARKAALLIDLTADVVSELISVLQAGPWTSQQRSELVMALSNSMLSHSDASASNAEKRPMQILNCPENYFDQADADVIMNKNASWPARMERAIARMAKMGFHSGHEQSKCNVFNVLLAANGIDGMDKRRVRDLYVTWGDMVTRRFKNRKTDASFGYIQRFPDDPNQLQDSTLDIIYQGGRPVPLSLTDAQLKESRNLIIMRGTAKELKSAPTSDNMALREPTVNIQYGRLMNNMMNVLSQYQQSMMQTAQASNVPIHFLTPPSSPALSSRGSFESVNMEGVHQAQLAVRESANMGCVPQAQLAVCGSQSQADPPRMPALCANPVNTAPTVQPHGTQSPAEQANTFMAKLKGIEEDADDHDDDADPDAGAMKVMKKPSKANPKAKAKAKAKAKSKAAANTTAKLKTAGKDLLFNPTWNDEKTRDNVICRPGLKFSDCGISSCSFTYAKNGGRAGAIKAAKKWVADFKKAHRCQ